jgi:hypothetical protein
MWLRRKKKVSNEPGQPMKRSSSNKHLVLGLDPESPAGSMFFSLCIKFLEQNQPPALFNEPPESYTAELMKVKQRMVTENEKLFDLTNNAHVIAELFLNFLSLAPPLCSAKYYDSWILTDCEFRENCAFSCFVTLQRSSRFQRNFA